MSTLSSPPAPTTGARRWLRVVAVVAAAVVPLAFAGLTIGALADSEDGLHRIPAAIVNQDEMVTQSAADGTETPVLAGRLLVTELTGEDSPGMAWRLSSADEAERALEAGEVYAVLTIPSDFSASVVSLSGSDPVQAQLRLETDDAHSYLAGAAAQSLGDGMVRAFGSELTKQYIAGIYTQFGAVGEAFTEAADGATQLSDGVTQFASGTADAASGASDFARGVGAYTGGVSQLSNGLSQLRQQTADLGTLGSGVAAYTEGVAQLSALMQQQLDVLADPAAGPVETATALATLQALGDQLEATAGQGAPLGAGAQGLGALATGIAGVADGAAELAANGGTVASGARELAGGVSQLATGASELSDGSSELAAGLRAGAEQLGGAAEVTGADAVDVAAEPVGLEVATANPVTQLGQIVGTYLVPLGLWAGALAIFLVLPPLSRRVLASTAGSTRVLGSVLARATAIAALQAVLLVALLHLVAGVDAALLPATLGFSLVAAGAFTAFHQLLTIGLGRAGLVISLLLLSVQLAATGGILPSEALAGPFSWLGSVLPLGWATTGLQQILAGGSAGVALGAALGLAAFGAASLLASRLALRTSRRATSLGMLLPASA